MNWQTVRKVKKPWPLKKDVLELAEVIARSGGRAYLVGGYVRDCLWQEITGRPTVGEIDYDLEVFGLNQEQVEQILSEEFPETCFDKVGKSFGVYKIYLDNRLLEVSLPRVETKIAPTHKGFKVDLIKQLDLKTAATRRDFTINAMMYDPIEHQLYDFFAGQDDLKFKILRPVSTKTFLDDPLRLWRAVQLAGRFELRISWTLRLLARIIIRYKKLEEVPKERVTQELLKWFLLSTRPSFGLRAARSLGLAKKYLTECYNLIKIKQHTRWHPEGSAWAHTLEVVDAGVEIADRESLNSEKKLILILACLTHDLGKAVATKKIDGQWHAHGHEKFSSELAQKLLARFTFKKEVNEAVSALAYDHMIPEHIWRQAKNHKNLDQELLKIALHLQQEKLSWQDLILLAEADQRGRNGQSDLPLIREKAFELVEWESWLKVKLLDLAVDQSSAPRKIMGRDLLTVITEPQGVWVGVLLHCLYLDQLASRFSSLDDGLILAKKYWTIAESQRIKQGLTVRQYWQKLQKVSDPRLRLV